MSVKNGGEAGEILERKCLENWKIHWKKAKMALEFGIKISKKWQV
jgi:hypothetical protein